MESLAVTDQVHHLQRRQQHSASGAKSRWFEGWRRRAAGVAAPRLQAGSIGTLV
jgi:hypothetical protein